VSAKLAALAQAGAWDEALRLALALEADPTNAADGQIQFDCAQIFLAMGDLSRAGLSAERAIALLPDQAGPLVVRAKLHAAVGNADAALADLAAAASIAPAHADIRALQVEILHRLERYADAAHILDAAAAAGASSPSLFHFRSVTDLAFGDITKAEAAARQALAGAADPAAAQRWLGTVLLQDGRVAEARTAFAAAIAANPDDEQAWTDDLFAANYDPTLDEAALKARYVAWGKRFVPVRAPKIAAPALGGRRLRVGYVSQDLRLHSIRHFLSPVVPNHDRTKVESFAYASVARPDAGTAALRPLFENWRDAASLDDTALLDAIRRDGIDVLVDLAGHTAATRLKLFARRAAPVQVTWLGYGGTTGVPEMDYYLGDAQMLPPGAELALTEKPWRLPRACFAYDPPTDMPDPGPLPALAAGHVTFASFSRLVRLNDDVIATWARILDAVPKSRLFLNALAFVDAGAVARMQSRFAKHGIAPERLELRYTRPQPKTWEAYRSVDIALDPFAHNGGVTSFEALWMGAPLVSLRARPPLGRYGDSLLTALDLSDWCTDSTDAYIARAVTAANDLDGLAALRNGMRTRMRSSALCDGPGLAAAMDAAFRAMREAA
jgi:predicted O-linked N-acetylglucosamine transferase (SPINDLY family)